MAAANFEPYDRLDGTYSPNYPRYVGWSSAPSQGRLLSRRPQAPPSPSTAAATFRVQRVPSEKSVWTSNSTISSQQSTVSCPSTTITSLGSDRSDIMTLTGGETAQERASTQIPPQLLSGQESAISDIPHVRSAVLSNSGSSVGGPADNPKSLASLFSQGSYRLTCPYELIFQCPSRFPSSDIEEWMKHAASHFDEHPPPERSICFNCDDIFEKDWDAWARHTAVAHLQKKESLSQPDFPLFKYFFDIGKIDKEMLEVANGWRPKRPTSVMPAAYRPPQSSNRDEICAEYDQRREDRYRRQRGDRSGQRRRG